MLQLGRVHAPAAFASTSFMHSGGVPSLLATRTATPMAVSRLLHSVVPLEHVVQQLSSLDRLDLDPAETVTTVLEAEEVTTLAAPITSGARLTADAERQLSRRWRDKRDAQSRKVLIEANLGLVISIACGLVNRGIPMDELIAEGNVGLIRAVDGFDPEAGFRFSTYAFRHIRHSMTALFAARSPRGKLKHAARQQISAWESAVASLESLSGVRPSDEEVSLYLKWPLENVRKARRLHSMVAEWSRTAAEQAIDLEPSPTRPDSAVDRAALREQLRPLLSLLEPREREAIELLYGLGTRSQLDPKRVAHIMGCSPKDVVRLKFSAQLKLSRHGRMMQGSAAIDE